jgi:DNA repair protein RadC
VASNIILAHNHPSGNTFPSLVDEAFTLQIRDGCKLLGINMLDHLIIGRNSYYSFADKGAI